MWPAASPRYSTADPVQISASVSLLEVAGRKRRPHAGLAISGFAFSSIVLTLTTNHGALDCAAAAGLTIERHINRRRPSHPAGVTRWQLATILVACRRSQGF